MYRIFWRTWWVDNPSWPGGREPGAGERHYVKGPMGYADDIETARCKCKELQKRRKWTPEQRRLSGKYEFESC